MCDMRIAAESARFAESFVKVGIVPGDGGAWLLPRVVGYSKACEMAFTGDMLNAQEALACGLVSRVVPDAELLDGGEGAGGADRGQPALRRADGEAAADRGTAQPAGYAAGTVGSLQALAHSTADHREAVNAFLEKRKPDFKGD